jgi:hypothetical protein
MRSSFFRLWTFYSHIIYCLETSRFFLLTRMAFWLSVQISQNLSETFRTMPVLPVSAPEITLILWPYLNFFTMFYKVYYIFSFLSYLFLQIITATLSIISNIIP